MINWLKGLEPWQEERLKKLLEEESKIPIMTHTFKSNNKELVITGRLLPKNRLVQERDIGYMHFVETEDKLETFSAFNWKLEKSEEV